MEPGLESDALGAIGAVAGAAVTTVSITTFVINIFLAASMQLLWGMINALQIMVHYPLLNLRFPANADLILSSFMSIASFDIIPTDSLYDWLFNLEDDGAHTDQLEIMGYESKNLIDNLGMVFLINLIGLAAFATLGVLSYSKTLRYRSYRFIALRKKLYNFLIWNGPIRFFLEGYIEYALSSMINIHRLSFATFGNIVDSTFTIFYFVVCFAMPFYFMYFFWKNRYYLSDKDFMAKYEAAYEGCKTQFTSTVFYSFNFMFRRLVLCTAIIFGRDYPYLQV